MASGAARGAHESLIGRPSRVHRGLVAPSNPSDRFPTDSTPSDPRGEDALIDALVASEPSAFEALVRTRGGRMLAVASRYLQKPEDAEDAVQEAFVAVFRSVGGFSRESGLDTWIHRIVVNCALMTLRRRKRKPELPLAEEAMDDGGASPWRRWPSPPAHEILSKFELKAVLREEIDQLPEAQRTVLLLRDVEGFELREIAQLLDVGLSTVKVRLQGARSTLQSRLGPRLAASVS